MSRLSLQQIKERRAVLNHEALVSTTMTDKDDILLNSREVAFLLDLSPDTVDVRQEKRKSA